MRGYANDNPFMARQLMTGLEHNPTINLFNIFLRRFL